MAPTPDRRLTLHLWSATGLASVALATVGIVVPLLPTTPLVLLAAFCFARGSPRLHAWLLGHRVFGPPLRTWRDDRGITRRTKALAIVSAWIMLGGTVIVLDPPMVLDTVLTSVLLLVTAAILGVPTARRATLAEDVGQAPG